MNPKILISAAIFMLHATITPALAQEKPNNVRKAGKYSVELRPPIDGIFAGEETDIEFHISDASQDDPVLGAPPVVGAKIVPTVTVNVRRQSLQRYSPARVPPFLFSVVAPMRA